MGAKRIYSDEELVEALTKCPTITDACAELGCTPGTFQTRARVSPAVAAARAAAQARARAARASRVARVAAALRTHGTIAAAARALGVAFRSVEDYVERYPSCRPTRRGKRLPTFTDAAMTAALIEAGGDRAAAAKALGCAPATLRRRGATNAEIAALLRGATRRAA